MRGRQISSTIVDFALHTVGPFPQAYPLCAVPQHPEQEHHRAVFRREHVLIYRVTPAEISFLPVYGAWQNEADFTVPA